jgi:hypothetical protein
MSGAARHLTVLMDTKAIWLSLPPKLAFVTEVQATPTDILGTAHRCRRFNVTNLTRILPRCDLVFCL